MNEKNLEVVNELKDVAEKLRHKIDFKYSMLFDLISVICKEAIYKNDSTVTIELLNGVVCSYHIQSKGEPK
jgi:hypothetical protein